MLTAAHVNGGINRPIFNFFNFFKTIIIIVFSVLNTGRAHSIREGRPCRMRVIEKQPFRRQESTEFHVYSLRDKHGQVDPTFTDFFIARGKQQQKCYTQLHMSEAGL
jgi:hypothetical protein